MGEIFDVYDVRRNKVNKLHERGVKLLEGDYRLVVHIWIINENGEILIQKRVKNKSYGGMWDCSAGGCATKGHTSITTAVREVEEEIGIKVLEEELERICTLQCSDVFDDIYIVRKNIKIEDVKIQIEEVEDVKIVTYKEIQSLLAEGQFVRYKYLNYFKEILESTICLKEIYTNNNYNKNELSTIEIYNKNKKIGTIGVEDNNGNNIKFSINIENLILLETLINRIELMFPQYDTWKIGKNPKIEHIVAKCGYKILDNEYEKECKKNKLRCLRE